MLWAISGVLVLLWLRGFSTHGGGALIHLVLVVALVMFIVNQLTGRRTVWPALSPKKAVKPERAENRRLDLAT